jgi:hypothetical protein
MIPPEVAREFGGGFSWLQNEPLREIEKVFKERQAARDAAAGNGSPAGGKALAGAAS